MQSLKGGKGLAKSRNRKNGSRAWDEGKVDAERGPDGLEVVCGH